MATKIKRSAITQSVMNKNNRASQVQFACADKTGQEEQQGRWQ
jgi:hypothetical protein